MSVTLKIKIVSITRQLPVNILLVSYQIGTEHSMKTKSFPPIHQILTDYNDGIPVSTREIRHHV